jgi:hypothetical protein
VGFFESVALNSMVSIKQILTVLKEFPFMIEDYDKREMIARYLIEDNNVPSAFDEHLRYISNVAFHSKFSKQCSKRP